MKNQVSVTNPFATTDIAKHDTGGIINTKSQREAMEVQAMVVMAKQFPRNQILAMDRILNACTRPSLAEGAVYSYPRGGQNVEGPSIRLAEVLAQNWGNIDFGIRELSQSNGESTVEAFAWDLETNTRQVKVFQVPHKRFTKQGTKTLTDPRDVYELIENNGARRLRACILGVIPGDVVEQAVSQCSQTLAASVNVTEDGIKAMAQAFEAFGVTNEMIQMRYQCRIEAIRPAQYIELRKIYASLKDGMSKPQDWFAMPEAKSAQRSDLNDLLTEQQQEAKEDDSK
ncbi:MAG: hypothetical protein M3Z87_16960 [Lactobacillus sp.]|nr:hypothetical protein [Lactobacillus sp.]